LLGGAILNAILLIFAAVILWGIVRIFTWPSRLKRKEEEDEKEARRLAELDAEFDALKRRRAEIRHAAGLEPTSRYRNHKRGGNDAGGRAFTQRPVPKGQRAWKWF